MRPRPSRLRMEALEDRANPTAFGAVAGGSLSLSGTPDGPVVVTALAGNQYKVTDNGNPITGSPFTLSGTMGGITINFADVVQDVTVDMDVYSLPRNITANMGSVLNGFTLTSDAANLTNDVKGSVTVNSKNGASTVVAIDDTTRIAGALTVQHGAGSTYVLLNGAVGTNVTVGAVSPNGLDLTEVDFGGSVGGNLTVNSASNSTGAVDVDLQAGSTVSGSVLVSFSAGTSTVVTDGTITKNLTVTAYNNTGNAAVTVDAGGAIGGGVAVGLGLQNAGAGVFTLDTTAPIGGGLTFVGGRTGDEVTINDAVARGASFNMGAGNDTLVAAAGADFNTSMGSAITQGIYVDAGAGDDEVSLANTIRGNGGVYLGAGNDLLDITDYSDNVVAPNSLIATNGGSGTDTLTGYASQDTIFLNPVSRAGDYESGANLPPVSPPPPPPPGPTVVTYTFSGNRPAA